LHHLGQLKEEREQERRRQSFCFIKKIFWSWIYPPLVLWFWYESGKNGSNVGLMLLLFSIGVWLKQFGVLPNGLEKF
jgi:hypothetical protein